MKIAAIIQARCGATRLPDKIFCELSGKPLLEHVINRARAIEGVDEVILATTESSGDDKVEKWAADFGVQCFRGSEEDVLARYYHAAESCEADVVIRVTADDPFKDPVVTGEVLKMFLDESLDFAFNNKPPSFPEGLDTEIFTFKALKEAFEESVDLFEREHVTQFFYRRPERYSQKNFSYHKDISYLRWTVDTEKDLEMAKKVYAGLYKEGQLFLMNEILEFLDRNPDVAKINCDVARSAMYSSN